MLLLVATVPALYYQLLVDFVFSLLLGFMSVDRKAVSFFAIECDEKDSA